MSTRNEKTDDSKENMMYVVNFTVLTSLVTTILDMYLDFVLKLITALPKGYLQLDLVTDSHCKYSIIDPERAKRSSTIKTITTSPKSKVPKISRRFCPVEKTRPA